MFWPEGERLAHPFGWPSKVIGFRNRGWRDGWFLKNSLSTVGCRLEFGSIGKYSRQISWLECTSDNIFSHWQLHISKLRIWFDQLHVPQLNRRSTDETIIKRLNSDFLIILYAIVRSKTDVMNTIQYTCRVKPWWCNTRYTLHGQRYSCREKRELAGLTMQNK